MSMKIRNQLIAATALTAVGLLSPQAAMAQEQPASTPTAQDEAPGKVRTETAEDILQEIVVKGNQRRQVAGGLMILQRQPETTNSITAEAIEQKMGIAGPYQLVSTLPGVSTGQSDPYQMSIRYGLFIRGLPMNKLGWVVDGMAPMDRAYLLPYSETYVDNENIAGLTIHPGSARIADPVQTAVGGEFSITVRDPSKDAGGQASYSHGSFAGRRWFGSLDTGEIGDTGLKAFASASYTRAGNFTLPGDAIGERFHADFKVTKDWGNSGKSSIFVSYNDWDVVRSLAISQAQFKTAGQTGNYAAFNYKPTWDPTSNSNNFWKHGVYTRENLLIAWNNDFDASDSFHLKVTPYYQWIKSNSPGGSSLNPASIYAGNQLQAVSTAGLFLLPNGNIPVKTNILQNQHAYGVNTIATFDVTPSSSLQFGWWYDHFSMDQLNNFSPISIGGNAPDWGANPLLSTSGRMITGANYTFRTNINALSLLYTQSLLDDKLKFELGLKYFIYRLTGQNLVPGPQSGMQFAYEKLLPRATISYDIDDRTQVYGNIITETRTNAPITTYPNTYNASTGALAQAGNLLAPPEYAIGQELGVRYHKQLITVDVALFNKLLKNNSITSLAFLNGAGVNSTLSGGDLKMRGITAEFAFGPFHGFSPYINGQYLWTQTQTDIQVASSAGVDFLPTKGKEGVQAPKWTATAGINYDDGVFFGNLLWKYTGSQWGTFMNDERMPAYSSFDMSVGYRLPEQLIGKESSIRISATNLGNKPQLATFASAQTNSVATTGIKGTTIPGRTVTYWLGSPRAIMGTFTVKF